MVFDYKGANVHIKLSHVLIKSEPPRAHVKLSHEFSYNEPLSSSFRRFVSARR